MRKYASMLSLGAGPHSMAECYDLHKRLSRCFKLLGGMQQPLHRKKTEQDEIQDRQEMAEIYDFVKDIAMALTGNTIESWSKKEE